MNRHAHGGCRSCGMLSRSDWTASSPTMLPTSTGSGSGKSGDASDSSSEDDYSGSSGGGRGGGEAAPQQEQQPAAGFQLFGCELTRCNLTCQSAQCITCSWMSRRGVPVACRHICWTPSQAEHAQVVNAPLRSPGGSTVSICRCSLMLQGQQEAKSAAQHSGPAASIQPHAPQLAAPLVPPPDSPDNGAAAAAAGYREIAASLAGPEARQEADPRGAGAPDGRRRAAGAEPQEAAAGAAGGIQVPT